MNLILITFTCEDMGNIFYQPAQYCADKASREMLSSPK